MFWSVIIKTILSVNICYLVSIFCKSTFDLLKCNLKWTNLTKCANKSHSLNSWIHFNFPSGMLQRSHELTSLPGARPWWSEEKGTRSTASERRRRRDVQEHLGQVFPGSQAPGNWSLIKKFLLLQISFELFFPECNILHYWQSLVCFRVNVAVLFVGVEAEGGRISYHRSGWLDVGQFDSCLRVCSSGDSWPTCSSCKTPSTSEEASGYQFFVANNAAGRSAKCSCAKTSL